MGDLASRLTAALADRYRIQRELGAGGMATVYLAEDLKHRRNVAVKVLRPELSASIGAERFLREIEVAAALTHPHILPLHDCGEADGFLYYVMPYIEGESLRDRLAREGELPVPEAVRILKEIVDALSKAHAQGVVHRDIKPDNVMLADRHALVTDFGVAKAVSEATGRESLTTAGVALGTPTYMAPEQAVADPNIDHRADIYAIGAVAYELLTGHPPFAGDSPQRILSAHVTEAPRAVTDHRAAVPPVLAHLVMKCLEKKPADRWQTAEELLPQLEALATPSGGTVPIASVARQKRMNWRLAAIVAVVAGVLAISQRLSFSGRADPAGDRIAVMPFANQTGADSLDTFGMITADVLTNGLVRAQLMNVVATASVLSAMSNGGADPQSIRMETEADVVVTGSYHLRGDSIAVQAQLTGPDNNVLASVETVVRPGTDRTGLLEVVLEGVLVSLASSRDTVFGPLASQLDLPMSLEAYGLYMTGNQLYYEAEYDDALGHYYRALELDSSAAAVMLMIATTEWNANQAIGRSDSILQEISSRGDRLTPGDRVSFDFLRAWVDGDRMGAYRASSRGCEIDSLSGMCGALMQDALNVNRPYEAWRAAAIFVTRPAFRTGRRTWEFATGIQHRLGDHELEIELAREGIQEIGPLSRLLRYELRGLVAAGRIEEAKTTLGRLAEISAIDAGHQYAAWEARRHGDSATAVELAELAVQTYQTAVARDTTLVSRTRLAASLYLAGRFDESRDSLTAWLATNPSSQTVLGYLGIDAARRNDTVMAEDMIGRLGAIQQSYTYGANVEWQSRIAAALGQRDRAMRYLERSVELGNSFNWNLFHVPEFETMRGYPPFDRFMALRDSPN